jgi:hypothetical protein
METPGNSSQPTVAPAGQAVLPAPSPPATSQPAQRSRSWPAILTLYVLAPVIAEMLSGSTPPLAWLNPINPVVQPALYGSGAILARELVRRRGLGWGNLLVVGAAYSILEEGLAVQTWFNFSAPSSPSAGLGTFGTFFGTSWVWAAQLAVYHAVVSISIPVLLVELLFPRIAGQPWLRRRGVIGFSVLLALVTLVLALLTGFVQYAREGYTHPPLGPYVLAAALMVGIFWLGLRLRFPQPRPSPRPAPRLWTVRLSLFAVAFVYFVLTFFLPKAVPIVIVTLVATVGIVALALWRVRSWSARQGWSPRHRLAIATGILAFFAVIFAPLLEFAARPRQAVRGGLTVIDLVFLLSLFVLDRRLSASPGPSMEARAQEGSLQ